MKKKISKKSLDRTKKNRSKQATKQSLNKKKGTRLKVSAQASAEPKEAAKIIVPEMKGGLDSFGFKTTEKLFGLKTLDKDTLIYRVLPRLLLEIMRKYFRLKVEGIEKIPKTGPVIIAPNHSGYSGFDALLLAYTIQKEARRIPRVLTHYFWFLAKATAIPAHKLGFTEATYENGLKELRKNNSVILFPEGEHGNFKPSAQMYELQEFKRGFVRMALETGAVIVPTIIIGAEETHINLSQLKFTKFLRGLVIPLPLNFIPLPAKWKIKFLDPIRLPFQANRVDDVELVHELTSDIEELMQKALNKELQHRGWIYF